MGVFPFFLSLYLDCGTLCWPMRKSTKQMKSHGCKIHSKLQLLPGGNETCWFNLNFLTSSPGVGCFVYSNHMLTIWCYIYVLLSVFFDQAVTVNFLNLYQIWIMHTSIFESEILVQRGLDLFFKKSCTDPFFGVTCPFIALGCYVPEFPFLV